MKFRSRPVAIVCVAAAYLAAARFGFTMALTAEQVTLVWPPTGLALAVLLVFGFQAWPGILIGAFLANVTLHEPVLVAVAIAGGDTPEAVAPRGLVRGYAKKKAAPHPRGPGPGPLGFGA